MPRESFVSLMKEIRDDGWFKDLGYGKTTAIGLPGVSLDLLVLGSLRYLGRGWTFDDLEEATGISQESHRKFFHHFCAKCSEHLYPKWVKMPTTEEELRDCMLEFEMAKFPGCIGSTDATHIILENVPFNHRNN